MIRFLYENLILRSFKLQKEITTHHQTLNSKKDKTNIIIDDNMKMAMNLASSVLNLSTSELQDIISCPQASNHTTSTPKNIEMDINFQFQNLMTQFDRELSLLKVNKTDDDSNFDNHIFELISEQLNDLFSFERQLGKFKIS
jgi:hypothetical protein